MSIEPQKRPDPGFIAIFLLTGLAFAIYLVALYTATH